MSELAIVEVDELAVALEQVAELRGHLVARAREEQPQILHGRAVHAVVEIDEVRPVVGPQHVVAMAVAVNAQLAIAADLVEALLDRVDELLGDALVALDEMRRQPIAVEHLLRRARAHLLAIERRPLLETAACAPTAWIRPKNRPSHSRSSLVPSSGQRPPRRSYTAKR